MIPKITPPSSTQKEQACAAPHEGMNLEYTGKGGLQSASLPIQSSSSLASSLLALAAKPGTMLR